MSRFSKKDLDFLVRSYEQLRDEDKDSINNIVRVDINSEDFSRAKIERMLMRRDWYSGEWSFWIDGMHVCNFDESFFETLRDWYYSKNEVRKLKEQQEKAEQEKKDA